MPDSEDDLDSLAVSLSGPALSCCGKHKALTDFFLLHRRAAEAEPCSVVLDISSCFLPSLLLQ